MITATFDEEKFCIVPIEPTNQNLLDLALVHSWDEDEEGECTERDFTYEAYQCFIDNVKEEKFVGVIVEKNTILPDNVKVELNTINILKELSESFYNQDGISTD